MPYTAPLMTLLQVAPGAEDTQLDVLAGLLKAAGDPLRLQALQVLGYNSFAVLELAEILDMRQSGMSHHLKVLAKAALVEQRRGGNTIFYRRQLPDPQAETGTLHRALLERLDAQDLAPQVARRLAGIEAQRAAQSRAFFERNGGDFDAHDDPIADYAQYGDLADELLARALPEGGDAALEVGPGDGRFLVRLAGRFRQVAGLESSEAMLTRARHRVADAGLKNVRLILGDWPQAAPPRQFDAVVLNMVLHHLPTPADCFVTAARRLRRGGVLVITELCRHDQAWARERCGDQWLGFDEQELEGWAQRAGLRLLEIQFLAQRNGFQVQACSFVHADDAFNP